MVGTSRSETNPILLMPPSITAPTIPVTTSPVIQKGIWNSLLKTKAMELDCIMFPVPNKQAIAPQTAKTMPMILANCSFLIPLRA